MQRTCCPDSATLAQTIEGRRLLQQESGEKNWYRWGPYLSERQWGTVREDYSGDGEPWDYLVHDDARCKTYRWGEDGLAGFSDVEQKLCLGLALWNGKDPILKERLFGLTNAQGNHGEDVKEYYYFLDALPSHAYCKMLYKYPQEAFPYAELEEHNSRRKAEEDEYELIDTGLFDDNRYFDILVEYGKGDIDDILLKVSATNRAAVAHPLTVIVQLWYRNVWSFSSGVPRPALKLQDGAVHCDHPDFSDLSMVGDQAEFLFCDNDTAAPDVPYPKE
ncbi:MAG: glucosidase, partial [Desulfobulbaceae bacterium]